MKWRDGGSGLDLTSLSPLARQDTTKDSFTLPIDDAQFRALLRRRYRASDDLLSKETTAVRALGPEDYTVSLNRVGRSDIYAFGVTVGTAHCSRFLFFRMNSGDEAAPSPSPPQGAGGEGDYCDTDIGWFGDIAGGPVFARSWLDLFSTSSESVIAPWLGDRWGSVCKVSVVFAPRFAVEKAFYPGAPIPGLESLAPKIVAKRERGPLSDTFSYGPPPTALADGSFERMKHLAVAEPRPQGDAGSLPTFGNTDIYPDGFLQAAVFFPLEVGGQTYLSRLGHASIGARELPYYLLALYTLQDDKLAPVAGLVISMLPGDLKAVVVDGPKLETLEAAYRNSGSRVGASGR
ncbi:MAG: hypothetical protein M3T55_10255 [Pseudomonadota bacterium]|nr:hypothetical protein [Pseudomonadota bacterium]